MLKTMDLVQCQFMTLIIILLVINLGLVIGVFLKWHTAQKKCKDGQYRGSFRRTATGTDELADGNMEISQEYPFIVAIIVKEQSGFGSELHCGGAIVGTYWVLTAAHCVEMLKGVPVDHIIVTGGSKLWRIAVNHEVDFMMHHKDYNKDSFNNDIGLVKLKQPFSDAFEKQIKVADESYSYEANRTVAAVGWTEGYYKKEVYRVHDVLRSINVSIFDQHYCKDLYNETEEEISESMFCAGSYTGEKPACRLDFGGPVLDGTLLIGVVSWGWDCGKVDQPAVYTKISIFENWINDVTGHK